MLSLLCFGKIDAISLAFELCSFTLQNGRKSRLTRKMGVSSLIAIVAGASQRKPGEREIE